MPERSSESPRPAFLGFRIEPAYLISSLVLAAGVQNLLLLLFLGIAEPWAIAAGLVMLALAAGLVARQRSTEPDARPTLLHFAVCFGISVVLLLLGGEGRLFFANIDWQIRDTVTSDMIRNSWPFVYEGWGTVHLLRAPIGMYLLPALAGKAGGMAAADLVLLIQNSLFLAALMTLASLLFDTNRSRLLALLVVLLFSGMDIVGLLLLDSSKIFTSFSHLEGWAAGLQYSSTITLAFWVPQHALVGWCAGILFLLWQRGSISLGAFLSPLPLLALWSPLAFMGAAPFALFAGAKALLSRRLVAADIIVSALVSLLSLPALIYLQAGSESVGARYVPVAPKLYLLFQGLEILPYLGAAWLLYLLRGRIPVAGLLISTLCLLIFPFIQIGWSVDFMMRASIPALLILALATADVLQWQAQEHRGIWRVTKLGLVVTLVIGTFTPAHELARAVSMRPTPYPRCNLIGAWNNSDFPRTAPATLSEMTTYLARPQALPGWMESADAAIDQGRTAAPCWDRAWQVRR